MKSFGSVLNTPGSSLGNMNQSTGLWKSKKNTWLGNVSNKISSMVGGKVASALRKGTGSTKDMDTGINIMDLGLNEFRLDLLAYIKNHPDIEHAPFGMSAVVGSDSMAKPGVMFILRNRNNAVNIDKKNMLHPFYMVYVGDDGEVVCDHLHPKQLLDVMRHVCKGKQEYDRTLCAALNKETKDGRDMRKYSDLLHGAIDSIVSVKEESDIDSLFFVGETTALRGEIKGLDDFELITFLIIR